VEEIKGPDQNKIKLKIKKNRHTGENVTPLKRYFTI
jgi:hypothetical protein